LEDGWRIAALVLSTAGYVLALLLIPRIILERRHPSATVAWVLAIALLPVAGVPLYFLVGGRRVRRHIRAKIEAMGAPGLSVENRVPPDALPSPVAAACARVLLASGTPPPVSGNRLRLVENGPEAYEAVLGLIAEARDHIHAQFFILDVDVVGRRFVHALCARARAGVRVRLLLDAVGSWRALVTIARPLRKAGGEVAAFLPALPLHRKWSAHLRNHRKLLIADGTSAFLGGMNIGAHYMGPRADAGQWLDHAVVVRGTAVRDLQAVFLDDWAFATDQSGPEGKFFPSLPPCPAAEDAPLQVVPSGPDRVMHPTYQGVFTAFTGARERIWVATPYFVPDDAIGSALENAALRGLDVRLLVSARTDLKMVWLAGRSYYDDLMRAGVRIFLYQPSLLHAKVLVIDEAVGVAGSSNVDIRSFFLNFELGVFLYGPREVSALAAWFERSLGRAVEVSPEAFARRSRAVRLVEDTCRIFSPLL